MSWMRNGLAAAIAAVTLGITAQAAGALGVTWMQGFPSAGTPAKYDKVGVLKIGPASARNVLVLEPGTSAGGAYFVPLAQWIVAKLPGWQVWSVERRENLLEDQTQLNLAKHRRVTTRQLFDYYLGWLADRSITHHFQFVPDSSVAFAKQWGMRTAVEDLHRVIAAAKRRGGKVVLGGHSLGGSVVTAYASWDFTGKPGARDLAGLVYDDGGSEPAASSTKARSDLQRLNTTASPWLSFGGIGAPFAGIFNATGSTSALVDPNGAAVGQASPLIPAYLKPPVRVTNRAQYGYALNVPTSPKALIAAQAHLGRGVLPSPGPGGLHGWDATGALTPLSRYATMFSGFGIDSVDGTEWYFPQRLTLDTEAVGNGISNPAQSVLGVRATMGRKLPKRLLIYAFGAALGGSRVLTGARALASQSGIPRANLTLIDRHGTYAHNDPAGAYPHNVFFDHLITFLKAVAKG